EDRPGGAANVALNAAALGSAAVVIGLTGADEQAESLQLRLESAGILPLFQKEASVPTITKLRVISRHQQLMRLDFEESFESIDLTPLVKLFEEQLSVAGTVVLSDYGTGALRDPQALIQLARQRGVPVLVDPKGRDFTKYRGATLITPNLAEFERSEEHTSELQSRENL